MVSLDGISKNGKKPKDHDSCPTLTAMPLATIHSRTENMEQSDADDSEHTISSIVLLTDIDVNDVKTAVDEDPSTSSNGLSRQKRCLRRNLRKELLLWTLAVLVCLFFLAFRCILLPSSYRLKSQLHGRKHLVHSSTNWSSTTSSTNSLKRHKGPQATNHYKKSDDPLREFHNHKPVSENDLALNANELPASLSAGTTVKSIQRRDESIATSNEYVIRQGPDPPAHHIKKVESTTPLHAVDSLQCGVNVRNFVVNATDGKDECDGLIKAFDKTCNNDPEIDPTDAGKGTRHARRLQRTKLSDKLGFQSYGRRWRSLVYRSSRNLKWFASWMPWRWLQKISLEQAITNSWTDASYVTEYKLEEYCQHHEQIEMMQAIRSLKRRKLEEAANQTITTGTGKSPESVTTLKMPTSHKMSEQTANDALLLQQGDKVIKQANETMAASQEAAKSKKGIADTSAAIMEVLSDPSSVAARTCCASILNVYQDLCSNDEKEQVSDSKLFFFVLVMALCGMVKSLIRFLKLVWLPEAGGCIIVGILSGYALEYFPHHNISFDGDWFLRILVPPIVFEAALSIDKRSFNRHLVPIIIYAVVGTLMATVLTAEIVHNGSSLFSGFCAPIPYVEALTFGALISSIDPIAVLSVLNNMGMNDTDTIYVLIFGESLLNDGVAIVLFHTLVHFLDENLVIDDDAIMAAALHFFVVAFGSLLVGVASGMLGTVYYWIFYSCQTAHVEVLVFFCWALLPYYVCDGIGWSGIVATVAVGFVMDLHIVGQQRPTISNEENGGGTVMDLSEHTTTSYGSNGIHKEKPMERLRRRIFCSSHGHLSSEAKTHIGFVTEIISTAMETAIFAYLGFFLFSHRYHWNSIHMVVAVLACCLSRAAMIPSLGMIANWITRIQQRSAQCKNQQSTNSVAKKSVGVVIDKKMQIVLWFAGLRGAMSFALVEHIPLYDSYSGEGTRLKPELKAMTSASIIFTVFVLGGYTFYVMEKLGVSPTHRSTNNIPSTETVPLTRGVGPDEDGEGIISNINEVKPGKATTFRRKLNILSV